MFILIRDHLDNYCSVCLYMFILIRDHYVYITVVIITQYNTSVIMCEW